MIKYVTFNKITEVPHQKVIQLLITNQSQNNNM